MTSPGSRSSRPLPARALVAVASVVGLALASAVSVGACSSSSDDAPAATDAGKDAARDAVVVDSETRDLDAAPEPTTADCLATCKAAHPDAVAKYDAIDTCWSQSCLGPCVNQSGSFDAGSDPVEGGTLNDGGTDLCGTMVSSAVDRACDDCTEAFCCPSWTGCYDDADCLDYNRCVNLCP